MLEAGGKLWVFEGDEIADFAALFADYIALVARGTTVASALGDERGAWRDGVGGVLRGAAQRRGGGASRGGGLSFESLVALAKSHDR